jgi:hypothetical protein
MSYPLHNKTKQFFWLAIKLAIGIGCGYLIYNRLLENEQLEFAVFYRNLIINGVFSTKNLVFLFIFTFFNHFFEILKWEALASFCTKITRKSAAIQSLASLTASLITPNRIGEYGAKAMYFEYSLRKQIMGLNLVGNFYQMGMTIIFGGIGLVYFVYQNSVSIAYHRILKVLLLGLVLIAMLYYAIKHFKYRMNSVEKVSLFIKKTSYSWHLKIAFLSFLRFVVFTHQFYYLLLIFKVDISYFNAISAITTMYLIASMIPMLSLFDVVLKGTVAVWVFYVFGIAPVAILCITTLMWVLNFVIPTLIGSYFVLTFNPKLAK